MRAVVLLACVVLSSTVGLSSAAFAAPSDPAAMQQTLDAAREQLPQAAAAVDVAATNLDTLRASRQQAAVAVKSATAALAQARSARADAAKKLDSAKARMRVRSAQARDAKAARQQALGSLDRINARVKRLESAASTDLSPFAADVVSARSAYDSAVSDLEAARRARNAASDAVAAADSQVSRAASFYSSQTAACSSAPYSGCRAGSVPRGDYLTSLATRLAGLRADAASARKEVSAADSKVAQASSAVSAADSQVSRATSARRQARADAASARDRLPGVRAKARAAASRVDSAVVVSVPDLTSSPASKLAAAQSSVATARADYDEATGSYNDLVDQVAAAKADLRKASKVLASYQEVVDTYPGLISESAPAPEGLPTAPDALPDVDVPAAVDDTVAPEPLSQVQLVPSDSSSAPSGVPVPLLVVAVLGVVAGAGVWVLRSRSSSPPAGPVAAPEMIRPTSPSTPSAPPVVRDVPAPAPVRNPFVDVF